MRQIVLDTETTGLQVEQGHRIIEIGCIELIDRKITGKTYHQYINPEREIDQGAQMVHGLTQELLQTKPVFKQITADFLAFIKGAELIIHNASFDVGFINAELALAKSSWQAVADHCRIFDTLMLARKLHTGQRNSLDALCKRYGIDNSKREFHGALLDAHLLAQVYLIMTGGQGSLFGEANQTDTIIAENVQTNTTAATQYNLPIIKASAEELAEHEKYLQMLVTQGKCVWV